MSQKNSPFTVRNAVVGFSAYAVTAVVGFSAYAVSKAVIKNNVAEPETGLQKATLTVGSMVIAQIVSGMASEHVDKKIGDFLEALEEIKKKSAEKA